MKMGLEERQRISVTNLNDALYTFQDNTFYLLLNGDEAPQVYAIDIGDEPTICKFVDSFSAHIKYVIDK